LAKNIRTLEELCRNGGNFTNGMQPDMCDFLEDWSDRLTKINFNKAGYREAITIFNWVYLMYLGFSSAA
jgi:hypothetical protein